MQAAKWPGATATESGTAAVQAVTAYRQRGEKLHPIEHVAIWMAFLYGALARGNSMFPLSFGLACCAIEWMSHIGSRMDIARFGFEAARASPRQADTIILSGRISIKMAPVIRRIYDQMLEPKYSIAMGACSSSMGVFNNYALVPADKFMPVDLHIPGCPPRPESLVYGILKLRAMVLSKPDQGWRTRYGGRGTEEFDPSVLEVDPQAANADNVAGALGRTGPSA